MAKKNIYEIEFRSRFNKSTYTRLKSFLEKNAKDLGEDDKNVYFFILPDKLLKLVNNISKKSAEIVLKLNKIGRGSDFQELTAKIPPEEINTLLRILKNLDIYSSIIESFQKRHNYLYKNVEIALKYSKEWGYHAELEIVVNNLKTKNEAEDKIKLIADELKIKLMTDEELKEFTKKAEKKAKERTKKKRNI